MRHLAETKKIISMMMTIVKIGEIMAEVLIIINHHREIINRMNRMIINLKIVLESNAV